MWASESEKDPRVRGARNFFGVLVSTLTLGWVEGCWG